MNRTILVIDDEKRLAESLAKLLRDSGYDVDAATGGRQGLEMLAKKDYRLVITDLRMPEVDGFQIMDHISNNYPNTAMIIITGHASTQSAIEAIHQRVADYLTKPFEFDFLIASIEKAFARIETEELRHDMMRMISHDIKVPLNSIMGYAQFIVDKKTGEISKKADDYAQKIILNSQRILTLLDNYLTHARAEAGSLEIIPQPMKLEETIQEAVRLLASEFERKQINLDMNVEPLGQYFFGDESLIFRALSNLLNNAVKYTPEMGKVCLELKKGVTKNGWPAAMISVKNTGPGIADEELNNIFSRFRRTASSKGIEGSGLGLYVVRHVAEAHEGAAECVPGEGDWVEFRLTLPIREVPALKR